MKGSKEKSYLYFSVNCYVNWDIILLLGEAGQKNTENF